MAIHFFQEDISFSLEQQDKVSSWLTWVAKQEGYAVQEINYIFTSDEYLLDINRKYLNHDYFTDIITFDYVNEEYFAGDVFISIDRVTDNAATYKVKFFNELLRVMVHGLLHLCGYPDADAHEKEKMRERETFYMNKIESF